MRYDLDQPLVNYAGVTIREDSEETSPPATLRYVLVRACLNASPQQHPTGEEKYRIHRLLTRINSAKKQVDLTSEEVTLLKTLVGESFSVGIVGPVYDVLEGATPPASEDPNTPPTPTPTPTPTKPARKTRSRKSDKDADFLK